MLREQAQNGRKSVASEKQLPYATQNSFVKKRKSDHFSKSHSKDLKLAPNGNVLLRAPV
jgi:hypothetical protein